MPWYDMPLERLREYRTSTQEPEGLDEWWAKRLDDARAQALQAEPQDEDHERPYPERRVGDDLKERWHFGSHAMQ